MNFLNYFLFIGLHKPSFTVSRPAPSTFTFIFTFHVSVYRLINLHTCFPHACDCPSLIPLLSLLFVFFLNTLTQLLRVIISVLSWDSKNKVGLQLISVQIYISLKYIKFKLNLSLFILLIRLFFIVVILLQNYTQI